MQCRPHCAACCTAISISSPLPLHPQGKPAGQVCSHLDPQSLRCRLWGGPDYPAVCKNFPPQPGHCGQTRADALKRLSALEEQTRPPARPATT